MLMRLQMLKAMFGRFRRDEDGLALTEYVVLLGLIVAAVIIAVQAFGTNLADTWDQWATWINNRATPPNT